MGSGAHPEEKLKGGWCLVALENAISNRNVKKQLFKVAPNFLNTSSENYFYQQIQVTMM